MNNEKTALLSHAKPPRRPSTTHKRIYPAPFYDPITHKLMKDPVVAPGGVTYERSSWEAICNRNARSHDDEPSAPAYDNRALKQVIEEAAISSIVQEKEETFRPKNFRRSSRLLGQKVQQSMRKNITQMMEKSILPSDDPKPLSDAYYCPITMSLMQHPVIGPEGYSFEKEAIERWIEDNQASPLTRTPLPSKKLLYPNRALREVLLLEIKKLEENESKLNSSIRDYRKKTALMLDQEKGQTYDYSVPATLKEWQALRQERRQSNIEFTINGLMQLVFLILMLTIGLAVGIVLGIVVLVASFVLDFGVAPFLQCCCPGMCHQRGHDPFGDDDDMPFIYNGVPIDKAFEEVSSVGESDAYL